jgi:hypothetical protein
MKLGTRASAEPAATSSTAAFTGVPATAASHNEFAHVGRLRSHGLLLGIIRKGM